MRKKHLSREGKFYVQIQSVTMTWLFNRKDENRYLLINNQRNQGEDQQISEIEK